MWRSTRQEERLKRWITREARRIALQVILKRFDNVRLSPGFVADELLVHKDHSELQVYTRFQASLSGQVEQRGFALLGEPCGGNHGGKRILYQRDRVNDATTMETSRCMRRVCCKSQRVWEKRLLR